MSVEDKLKKMGRPTRSPGEAPSIGLADTFIRQNEESPAAPEATQQLNVSVPASLHRALTREAFERSDRSGKRVTVKDLVVRALREAYQADT